MTDFPLVLRPAGPADQAAVTELTLAIDPKDYIPEIYDSLVESQSLLVAELDGRIVGCHAYQWPAPGQMYLFGMRIHPDMQGKGIGSAYCRAQIAHGAQLGARELWLTSVIGNLPAHRTVAKSGFVKRGEWILHENLPVAMLPSRPSRARAGRPADLPLLAPFRALFLGDVIAAPGEPYAVSTARAEDWDVADLLVVDDGVGALAGVMLLRETEWGDLYVRRLEGTPEAALELLAHAGSEGVRRGKAQWAASLPARAEHLLAPAQVDPAKAFRTYAFQYRVK